MGRFGRFDVHYDEKKDAAQERVKEIVMLKKQRGSFCKGVPDRPENRHSPQHKSVKNWGVKRFLQPVSLAKVSIQKKDI